MIISIVFSCSLIWWCCSKAWINLRGGSQTGEMRYNWIFWLLSLKRITHLRLSIHLAIYHIVPRVYNSVPRGKTANLISQTTRTKDWGLTVSVVSSFDLGIRWCTFNMLDTKLSKYVFTLWCALALLRLAAQSNCGAAKRWKSIRSMLLQIFGRTQWCRKTSPTAPLHSRPPSIIRETLCGGARSEVQGLVRWDLPVRERHLQHHRLRLARIYRAVARRTHSRHVCNHGQGVLPAYDGHVVTGTV